MLTDQKAELLGVREIERKKAVDLLEQVLSHAGTDEANHPTKWFCVNFLNACDDLASGRYGLAKAHASLAAVDLEEVVEFPWSPSGDRAADPATETLDALREFLMQACNSAVLSKPCFRG